VWVRPGTRPGCRASASDYIDLVLRNIGAETESTTVRTTLAQLQLAANAYVAPDKREAARVRVADGLWELAQDAEAGSDSQLQFVTAFASAAATPAQWETVRALRDGELTLPGLEIDADLSWALLVSLAAGGVVSPSRSMRRWPRTTRPRAESSRRRRRRPCPRSTPSVRPGRRSSTAPTFRTPSCARPLSDSCTRPASRRWSRSSSRTSTCCCRWESRTYQIANYLITGLYPAARLLALRDATRQWLAATRGPAALRRLVNENLAGVERALAVQERDADS
jgi:aminopeptidase N